MGPNDVLSLGPDGKIKVMGPGDGGEVRNVTMARLSEEVDRRDRELEKIMRKSRREDIAVQLLTALIKRDDETEIKELIEYAFDYADAVMDKSDRDHDEAGL